MSFQQHPIDSMNTGREGEAVGDAMGPPPARLLGSPTGNEGSRTVSPKSPGDIPVPNPFNMNSVDWSTSIEPDPVIMEFSAGVPVATEEPAKTSSRRSSSRKEDAPKNSAKTENNANQQKRQKRLERNRESARLSRRRRKQYLEVLEERVTQLSDEMDKGRREHVAAAISTVKEKRSQALHQQDLHALETGLVRTSNELRVAATFQTQQVQSLSLPPQTKFLLWLTLQTDTYFRGGRAASERLSAARIGERMLSTGTDKVSPAHGMWPLLCNEIGLSYDQEEKVRNFQRTLLTTHESWLHRHTAAASGLVIQSAHDAVQGMYHQVGERERMTTSVLEESQRLRFWQWAQTNKERLAQWAQKKKQAAARKPATKEQYTIDEKHHDAANLYIMNHRLRQVLKIVGPAPTLVPGATLKRLARRPSFESLGSNLSLSERSNSGEGRSLSREVSFSSTGSLKRSASELDEIEANGGEMNQTVGVSPMEAAAAAQPTLDAALGFVKELLPPRPAPQPDSVSSTFSLPPPPVKVTSMPPAPVPAAAPMDQHQYQYFQAPQMRMPQQPQRMPQQQIMVSGAPVADAYAGNPVPQQQPAQVPSMAAPLNVVPEETLMPAPSADGADDFLFELAEEDWAIGEGFEMDTTT